MPSSGTQAFPKSSEALSCLFTEWARGEPQQCDWAAKKGLMEGIQGLIAVTPGHTWASVLKDKTLQAGKRPGWRLS